MSLRFTCSVDIYTNMNWAIIALITFYLIAAVVANGLCTTHFPNSLLTYIVVGVTWPSVIILLLVAAIFSIPFFGLYQ